MKIKQATAYALHAMMYMVRHVTQLPVTSVAIAKAEGIWIVDLQSANGTTVNGRVVTPEPAPIGSGDMLSFGPATFALRIL